MEDEAPTRSSTPTRISAEDLYWRSAIDDDALISKPPCAPSIANTQRYFLFEKVERVVSAGIPRCAICSIDFTLTIYSQRVEHFNICWDALRKAVTENAGERRHLCSSGLPDDPQSLETVTPVKSANTCILCSLPIQHLSSIDAFEHRVLCQRSLSTPPTACPRCETRFITGATSWDGIKIAEHIYDCSIHSNEEEFQVAQHAWCEHRFKSKDPANCGTCTTALTHLDAVDAFHHRRKCLEHTNPVFCPVCFDALPVVSKRWALEDILWHIHSCQHGNTLSAIDRDEFVTLEAQWRGRTQGVWKMFSRNCAGGTAIGPRKKWTVREHQYSYRSKTSAGRDITSGLYLIQSSNLRSVATHAENDSIGITKRVRSRRAVWSNSERFRRSAYSVYKLPDHGNMISCMKTEYETNEAVYHCPGNPTETMPTNTAFTPANADQPRPWNTSTALLRWSDEEDHGRHTTRSQRSIRASQTSCRDLRRHQAIERAREAGIRVPPGFELHRSIGGGEAESSTELVVKDGSVPVLEVDEPRPRLALPCEDQRLPSLRFGCKENDGDEDTSVRNDESGEQL